MVILKKTFFTVVLLATGLWLLLVWGVTLPLDFLAPRLEAFVGSILDREVQLKGPARVKLSLHPILILGGLTIANPYQWPKQVHFLTASSGKGQIDLLTLLHGDIHLNNLEFEGVDLQLVVRSDHSTNFHFPSMQDQDEAPAGDHELIGLDRLSMRNIRLSYRDDSSGKEFDLSIDHAEGQGRTGNPMQFSLEGSLNLQPCSLEITGGYLHDLMYGSGTWPLTQGSLNIAGTTLQVSGELNRDKEMMTGFANLSLTGDDIAAFGKVFAVHLPEYGPFSLKGGVTLIPGQLQITGLAVGAFQSELQGDFNVNFRGTRPKLDGNIVVTSFNPALFTFLNDKEEKTDTTDTSQLDSGAPLPWEALQFIDADLHVVMKKQDIMGVQLDGMQGTFSLVDGNLTFPLSLAVMGTRLTGHLDVITSEKIPSISFSTTAETIDLRHLSEALAGEKSLNGQLGHLSFKAGASGKSIRDLLHTLELDATVADTIVHKGSNEIMEADRLSLQRMPGRFSLTGNGSLLGRPMNLRFSVGGPQANRNFTGKPVRLQLTACDTDLQFDGTINPDSQALLDFNFAVKGQNLCGFAEPLRAFLGQHEDYEFAGTGKLYQDSWALDLAKIRVGDFNLDANAELKIDSRGIPVMTAKINSDILDISPLLHRSETQPDITTTAEQQSGQVESIEPSIKGAQEKEAGEESIAALQSLLTRKILPDSLVLPVNMLLEFHIRQLDTGSGQIDDINISAAVQEGVLKQAPFSASIAGVVFSGACNADFSGHVPAIHLQLIATNVDIPHLFTEFQMDHPFDMTAGKVGLDLDLHGKTIMELLLKNSLLVQIQEGKWTIRRGELNTPLVIAIDRATYRGGRDKESSMELSGNLNTQPLALKISSTGLFGKKELKPVTLTMHATLAESELQIDGRILPKKDAGNALHLSTKLSGSSFDKLNDLLGVNLPPWGPYKIRGTLSMDNDIFAMHDMSLQVGSSELQGEITLRGTKTDKGDIGVPLQMQTKLRAESIQLNDFRFGQWSPVADVQAHPEASQDMMEKKEKKDGKQYKLFSPELSPLLNGTVDVEVVEVLSGTDKLGGGLLQARLEDGLYSLDTLRLEIPGGSVKIRGTFKPEVEKSSIGFGMDIEHLDYGILARRTVPTSNLKGVMHLQVDMQSTADGPAHLNEHLNGKFRFGVKPEEFQSGIIDLWAVNILTAALPALLKGNSSVVNCLAGDFTVTDGLMRPEVFILDTSAMRVQGEGEVDFKTNGIDFHLKPTPKSAHFFSLATPITISGTITEPHIGVTAGGVFGTIFRLATSMVTVPLQWIFSKNMEDDGHEACTDAMNWVLE